MVKYAQRNRIDVGGQDINNDILFFPRVFNGIVKEIEDCGAQLLGAPYNSNLIGRLTAPMQCAGG